MKLKGQLLFRNNQVYIKTEACAEINLFAWLASHGLKDKEVQIIVERSKEDEGD
ncbi:hypothetical protein ACFLX4_01110 [Chloroflexota bacterium]